MRIQDTYSLNQSLSKAVNQIAAPMVGGMLTAPLLSMLVIPVGYMLLRRQRAVDGKVLTLERTPGVNY